MDWIIVLFFFPFEIRSHHAALAGLEPAKWAMLDLNVCWSSFLASSAEITGVSFRVLLSIVTMGDVWWPFAVCLIGEFIS